VTLKNRSWHLRRSSFKNGNVCWPIGLAFVKGWLYGLEYNLDLSIINNLSYLNLGIFENRGSKNKRSYQQIMNFVFGFY